MPRFQQILLALAAIGFSGILASTGQAATQSLALLETDGATPLQCDGGICKAEFSTFCLQKDRDLPRAGDPYRLAVGGRLTLVLTAQDGSTKRAPAADYIRVEAARSGHTAVTVSIDQKQLGAQTASIEVGERVTLMPVPFAGDDNPQTEQDRRIATGPLRQLGAKIVDSGPHDVGRVHTLNRLINALPDAIDRRPDARQTLWRRAAGTAFDRAPEARAQAAKQEYAACWQDRLVQLHGYSVRHCLQRRHDGLMWEHVKRYWGAVGAGS